MAGTEVVKQEQNNVESERVKTSIGKKLLLGFGIILLFLVFLGVIVSKNIKDLGEQFDTLVNQDTVILEHAQELRKLVVDMETGQRGFIITGKEEFLEPYIQGRNRFFELLGEEQALTANDPEQLRMLAEIEDLVQEWEEKSALPEIVIARKVHANTANASLLQNILGKGVGKSILDEMRRISNVMGDAWRKDENVLGEYWSLAIRKAMIDQETGQRGFLITGKEEFLEPYTQGEIELKYAFEEIKKRM